MGSSRKRHQLTTRRTQRGIGLLGLISIIGIGAGIVMFGFAAVPMYMNHMTVMSIVDDVSADSELQKSASLKPVRQAISKRFQMNSLWDLNPEEVIKIHREGRGNTGFQLEVDYEVRRPLFYNMELVAHFNENKTGAH